MQVSSSLLHLQREFTSTLQVLIEFSGELPVVHDNGQHCLDGDESHLPYMLISLLLSDMTLISDRIELDYLVY